MMPDLPLGPLPFKGYGLMIGVGIVLAIWIVIREARRTGTTILEERMVTLFLTIAACAYAGGKLFFFLLYPDQAERVLEQKGALALLGEGFVYYGALALCIPAAILLLRKWKLPILRTLDTLMLTVPVMHGTGRLGCFLAGCCYGCRTDSPLAVVFPEAHRLHGIPVHPVQLYEAAGNLVIFLILWFGPRKRPRFPGQVTLLYLMLYGVLRFTTEWFRGDGNPVWVGSAGKHVAGEPPTGLTTGQVTSIAAFAIGALFYFLRARRAAANAARASS